MHGQSQKSIQVKYGEPFIILPTANIRDGSLLGILYHMSWFEYVSIEEFLICVSSQRFITLISRTYGRYIYSIHGIINQQT